MAPRDRLRRLRIGCFIDGASIRLLDADGRDRTEEFPAIVEEARRIPVERAALDGELSSPVYFAFDLLHRDGEDLSSVPLEERKSALRELLEPLRGSETIRYSEQVIGRGAELFRKACAMGLEAIISKRRDDPYRPGRGPSWTKAGAATAGAPVPRNHPP